MISEHWTSSIHTAHDPFTHTHINSENLMRESKSAKSGPPKFEKEEEEARKQKQKKKKVVSGDEEEGVRRRKEEERRTARREPTPKTTQ